MAIARVYSAGWGFGDTGTAAQGNALDVASTSLLDKQPGEGDTLGSIVGATGAGRIISTVATGTDSDQTFHPWGANAIVRVPTLTAARAYQLGLSGATGGDRMFFYVEGTGSTASGYADIKNSVGTAIYRLGLANGASGTSFLAESEAVEVIFSDAASEWIVAHTADRSPTLRGRYFTSTTSWVCPPGVFAIMLEGYGGGGGGAGGSQGGTGQWSNHGGGGGGGGARLTRRQVAVQPGRRYTITIGAGGAGGYASPGTSFACGGAGGNGGDTTFSETSSGNVLATFRGAEGGFPSRSYQPGVTDSMLDQSWGGRAIRPSATAIGTFTATTWAPTGVFAALTVFESMSRGGMGATISSGNVIRQGQYGRANERFNGGVAGAPGASSGGYMGGGGGGGGGAGPGGPGAAGGAGANTSASDATGGASALANSGAGGGGGGGGESPSGSAGGAGGSGGSGMLILTTIG